MRICKHTAGLEDLSRKDQADPEVVLHHLRSTQRFSVFEATANQTIARTVEHLCKERMTTERMQFPWTRITAIDGEPLTPTIPTP